MNILDGSIDFKRVGSRLYIEINHPRYKNALTPSMVKSLRSVKRRIDSNTDLIVIQSKEKFFCSGYHLQWMEKEAKFPLWKNFLYAFSLARTLHTLAHLPVMTIAYVEGGALGAGLGIASCCDIIVGHPDAIWGCPEIKKGIFPFVISPYLKNKDPLFMNFLSSAEFLSTDQLFKRGFVNYVTDHVSTYLEKNFSSDLFLKSFKKFKKKWIFSPTYSLHSLIFSSLFLALNRKKLYESQ